MLRRARGVAFGAALLLGILAPNAAASMDCSYDPQTHQLSAAWTSKANGPAVTLDGATIEIKDFAAPGGTETIACTGGLPTTANTDEIVLRDRSDKGTGLTIFDPNDYTPGFSDAGGDAGSAHNEIEMRVKMGRGRDTLEAAASEGTAQVWGRRSMNPGFELLDPNPDADVFFKGVERVTATSENDHPDVVSGAGALGTGGPLRLPMRIDTHDGDDVVGGGTANDYLDGGDDADQISGGAGRDLVTYEFGPRVNVTIGVGDGDDGSVDDGPSNARDTVAGDVENVIGSDFDDALTGNGLANTFVGGLGADELAGAGGSDLLKARDGVADVLVNCGGGKGDRAKVDKGLDPAPVSC